ncbi:SDR family oxidoreductase [Gulosibacter sp. 10]|uniref:SDR family oxidoreductase n=1 Tax=Gulosibacter sp. 10 TaxID=1255570 RepID=UPI000B35F4A3|nr:SDR family oxidoreductase [Gulosibacter sp. 10]
MNRLQGRTAVVTAAAQGIGRGVVERFVAEGAQVWAVDLNADALSELDGVEGVTTAACDVTDAEALAELARRTGPIDALFNGVGFVHVGALLETTAAELDASFRLNVGTAFAATAAFLPGMLEAGSGSIITMSSVQSSIRGFPNRLAYATSKAAIIGFTKSVAADYAARGIRCNAIAPSAVDTPSMRARIDAMPDPERAAADFASRQPVGRMGTPEDIAALAAYLASDESSFTTGSVVVIDGGASS